MTKIPAILLLALLALAAAWPRTSGRAAENGLPEPLRRDLAEAAAGPGDARARLALAAELLMEAGWRADSLRLQDGEIQLIRARRRALIVADVRGEETPDDLARGAAFDAPAELETIARRWLADMDRRGFPFAQVWLNRAPADGDTLSIRSVFVTGPSGPLGEVRVTGLERLSEKFVTAYLDLDEREPFSLSLAERGRDRLAATGWFDAAGRPVLGWDALAQRVCVLYDLKERKRSNRVVVALGGGGGETTGALELDLFSPFGGGRRWRLGGDWRGDERSLLDIDLTEPRLFGWGVGLDLGFHRTRQADIWLQLGYQADFRLLLPAGLEGIAGFGYERSLFTQTESEMSRRRHRFGLIWRSLDTEPPGARRVGVTTDYLIRRSDLPGETPEVNQFEGALDWAWLWRPGGPWKLRSRGGGRILLPEGNGFNDAELFSVGGATTLRGYDEEHFRGDGVAWSGLELALGDPLEVSLFMDYGWGRRVRPGAPTVDFSGWGVGLGLKAPAPGGLLTLSLAMGERKRLGDLRVHVGVDAGF